MASPQIDTSKPSSVSSRWLIPLGAVLVHICIGSVYAWSNFNRPIDAVFPGAPGLAEDALYRLRAVHRSAGSERGVRRALGGA